MVKLLAMGWGKISALKFGLVGLGFCALVYMANRQMKTKEVKQKRKRSLENIEMAADALAVLRANLRNIRCDTRNLLRKQGLMLKGEGYNISSNGNNHDSSSSNSNNDNGGCCNGKGSCSDNDNGSNGSICCNGNGDGNGHHQIGSRYTERAAEYLSSMAIIKLRAKLMKDLSRISNDVDELTCFLDQQRGDAEVKAARKAVTDEALRLSEDVDRAITDFRAATVE